VHYNGGNIVLSIHFSFIGFSVVTAFQQTQIVLLTALNFSFSITTTLLLRRFRRCRPERDLRRGRETINAIYASSTITRFRF
jgi:hypothetical protein